MLGPIGMQVSGIHLNTATLRFCLPPPAGGKRDDDVLSRLFSEIDPPPDEEDALPPEVVPYITVLTETERLTPAEAAVRLLGVPEFNALHAVKALALLISEHWQTVLDAIGEKAMTPWLEELAKDGGWVDLDEKFNSDEARYHVAWHYGRQLIRSMSTS